MIWVDDDHVRREEECHHTQHDIDATTWIWNDMDVYYNKETSRRHPSTKENRPKPN